jgi:potassium efflux system protein
MRLLSLSLLFSALSLPLGAQIEDAPERQLDLQEIRQTRQLVEANVALGEDVREATLKLYDDAIASLETAAADETRVRTLKRERAGVGRIVEALRAELDRPAREPRLDLPENATVGRAEAALARDRSRLAAARSALRDVERLAEERTDARTEISRRLGALDQQIDSLSDELRTATQRDTHPDLKRAERTSVLARRVATLRKIDSLRAELELLDERGVLIPWEIDRAQRRVAYSERAVELLEEATRQLRRQDADASLQRVLEQCRDAASQADALAGIAAETESFAEMLWGTAGVEALSEETTKALLATRKNTADLQRMAQLTRRKFEAVGYRGSIYRWWPEIPEDFPRPGNVGGSLRRLEQRIPGVQHQLIRFEQQRSQIQELANRTMLELESSEGEAVDPELQRTAGALLDTRRDLLDELIRQYGRYSNQLVELETISLNLLNDLEQIQAFLYERALWVRSVPRPLVPRAGDTGRAFLWSITPENWASTFGVLSGGARESGALGLVILLGFVLLIASRRPIKRRIATLAERVADPVTDDYRATLEVFLYTILLAAPLPLALYFGHVLLSRSDASTFLFSIASTLYFVALTAGLLELARQLTAPRGLAEAHLRWPLPFTRKLHRGLLWIEALFLPTIALALIFGAAGFKLSSPEELRVYNNSLGRIAFIAGMAGLGVYLLGLLRPRKDVALPLQRGGSPWSRRVYMYAYPLVVIATFVPALLAAFGYYLTGYLLTFWIAIGLLILGGLLFRWRSMSRRRATDGSEQQAQGAAVGVGIAEAEGQVSQLLRFVVILVAAIGLYTVWTPQLQKLQIVQRIQIWPRVALLDSTEAGTPAPAGAPGQAGEAATQEGAAEGGSGSKAVVPGMPIPDSGRAAGAAPGSSPLTLWHLLEALLAVVITTVLVRNIPGLLELILRRRTFMDSGARVALGTLVRYAILIIGVSVAFGLLGVSWSKIQWLAAALTFGLGFGLQEIVANFVSGLILLVERPIRVGDAVTIGNLQGRVTGIQIRATTVTLWDRSEMIVPNKEFVTTKLINWTLSDAKRRIDIPLRVAYGADLQRVKELLLDVARQHPDVNDDPPPQALLLEFGDDAIRFELWAFVDFGQGLKTKDDLQMAIDRTFREQGIEFALPQLSIRMPRRRDKKDASRPEPPPAESPE